MVTRYTFILLLNLLESVSSLRDPLALEKPDKFEIKMLKADRRLSNIFDSPKKKHESHTKRQRIEKTKAKLQKQVDNLKNIVGENNVAPVTDFDLWKKLYDYIIENLDNYLKDGEFTVSFVSRYNFCLFVIPIIPANFVMVFPAFYKIFFPPKLKTEPVIAEFLKDLDRNLNIIKKKSSTQLLVTTLLKRSGNIRKELEVIKEIPHLIVEDPMKLLRWIMVFKIEVL